MTTDEDIRNLPLAAIIAHCGEETANYRQRRAHDSRYCLELFRRSFEDGDQRAWDAVFARFWKAKRSTDFDFSSLSKVLSYLAYCVGTEIIDDDRRRKRDALEGSGELDAKLPSEDDPEEQALSGARSDPCWQAIMDRVKNESERLYSNLGLRLGFKPRQIAAMHPKLFPDAAAVHQTRANFIARLRRDDDLRAICGVLLNDRAA